jgi:hypothetical protein
MKDTELQEIIGLPVTTARDHKKRKDTWQSNAYWILQFFTPEQLKIFKELADKKREEYLNKKDNLSMSK